MKEIWREVYGYDVLYEVSNLGNVRTKYQKDLGYTDKYVSVYPVDNGNGYLRFNWKQSKKQKTVYLHRLVALYFIDNPNGHSEINHKDENKKNNRADNLEWCSRVYNANYGTAQDRKARHFMKKVRCVDTNIVYDSLHEAAEKMNVCVTAISNCLNGRAKSSCGYKWEYVNDAV